MLVYHPPKFTREPLLTCFPFSQILDCWLSFITVKVFRSSPKSSFVPVFYDSLRDVVPAFRDIGYSYFPLFSRKISQLSAFWPPSVISLPRLWDLRLHTPDSRRPSFYLPRYFRRLPAPSPPWASSPKCSSSHRKRNEKVPSV